MTDIAVKAGQSFQAAIDQAQPGDSITLEAGASFQGPFYFPPRSGFVSVRSSQLANFPAATALPSNPYAKLIVDNVEAAIIAKPQGSFWRFEGIEVATVKPDVFSYGLVRIGESDQVLADVPHHFTFDRCYAHALPTQNIQRGITMNGANIEVLNSRIDEIHWAGVEAQALGGWNGPGPFKIINCHLEAAGINILFGGARPSIPDLVPSDIEVRDNFLYKQLSWRQGDPSYAGIPFTCKNLFELKNARRVVVENNRMENSWPHSQSGWAVIFNVIDEDVPWNVIEDVRFIRNVIRHASNGFDLRGAHDTTDIVRAKRIQIADNLFEDIGAFNGESKGFYLLQGSEDVTIEHNTTDAKSMFAGLQSRAPLKHNRLIIRDNLGNHGSYGVFGDGGFIGTNALNQYCTDWKFEKNALYNIGPSGVSPTQYPPNNYFPVTLADANGLLGTDGQPVGVRGSTPPPVDPTPPTPVPPQLKKVAWPTQEGKQNQVMAEQRAQGYYPVKNLTGAYMQFEKVK